MRSLKRHQRETVVFYDSNYRCLDCRVGTQLQFGNVEGKVAKN